MHLALGSRKRHWFLKIYLLNFFFLLKCTLFYLFILKCTLFTMLCQSLPYSKLSYIHIDILFCIYLEDTWIKQLSAPSAYNLDLLNPLDIIFLNKAKWTHKMEHFKRHNFIRTTEKSTAQ